MKKIIAIAALALSFMPLARAEATVGDKVSEVKTDAVQTKRKAGAEIRETGREAKAEGRKVRQAVITRCADGRHTIRGKSGCLGHGGVWDPK